MTMDKRIIATFTPQEWIGDQALNLEEKAREVDVTAKILTMPLAEIKALSDDDYETDDLVDHNYDGPFKVEVEDSIFDFFNVSNLNDITQAMLTEAKNKYETRTQDTKFSDNKAHFTIIADIKNFGQFDPETLRKAIAEGIDRMRDEGLLTPIEDDTTEVGKVVVRLEDDDPKTIVHELYEALDDASSVVDTGEDEPRAYDAVLKRAGTYLGIDAEMASRCHSTKRGHTDE